MGRSSFIAATRTVQYPGPEATARLLANVRNGTCDLAPDVLVVDPSVFTSAEIARLERERVFGQVPFVVAHCSEIAATGDFIRLHLPNSEALLVRQEDGSARAFLNVCRHRGNLLEAGEQGSCRAFTCPYHAWSYGRDGQLRAVTFEHTFGDIDHAGAGLVPLPTAERHGLIWVIDNPAATVDLDSWLGAELNQSLGASQLEEFTCIRSEGFDEPVNWKIMQDAFVDGYHLQFVHARSAGPYFYNNRHVFEPLGRHVRFYAARKSIDRHLDELTASTDPTGPAVLDHVTMSHFVAPNVTLLRQPDHYQLLSFLPHPNDPCRCRMEMRLIVPPLERTGLDQAAWATMWDRNWDILMAVLRDEDFPLLRGAQQALRSAGAGPLTYGRNELANQVFHQGVTDCITEK